MCAVLVVGAGAVGGLLTYRLASASARVTAIVGKGEHSQTILRNGAIQVNVPGRPVHRQIVSSFTNPESLPAHFLAELSTLVVATKSYAGKVLGIDSVITAVRAATRDDIAIVPLLNTIDAHEQLTSALHDATVNAIVLPADTRVSVYVKSAGTLSTNLGHEKMVIDLGPAVQGANKKVVQRTADALSCHGVEVNVWQSGLQAIWTKCALATSTGVVAAACGVPCAHAVKYERTAALSTSVAAEMRAIAAAHGVDYPVCDWETSPMSFFRPGMLWSIQRDILQGNPAEVEAQVGTYVRRAKRLGVNTPTLDFLYAILEPRGGTSSGMPQIEWPHDITPQLPGKAAFKCNT